MNSSSIKSALSEIGLKDREIETYLSCLELGTSTAQEISKKAGIKRTYFYDIIENLIKAGLVSETRDGKRRRYSASDPEKLLALQEERMQNLHAILPQLKSVFNTRGSKPKILFYEGKLGIDEVNTDTLKYKREILAFTTEKFLTADEKKLGQKYIQKRVANNIHARVIGPMSQEILNLKKDDKNELRQTRVLPRDLFSSNVEFVFYGNRLAIINYREEFGIIIESNDVVQPLKMIFELIWKGGFVE